VPRFAIAPLGLTTEGSTKFKLKGWKCYFKKITVVDLTFFFINQNDAGSKFLSTRIIAPFWTTASPAGPYYFNTVWSSFAGWERLLWGEGMGEAPNKYVINFNLFPKGKWGTDNYLCRFHSRRTRKRPSFCVYKYWLNFLSHTTHFFPWLKIFQNKDFIDSFEESRWFWVTFDGFCESYIEGFHGDPQMVWAHFFFHFFVFFYVVVGNNFQEAMDSCHGLRWFKWIDISGVRGYNSQRARRFFFRLCSTFTAIRNHFFVTLPTLTSPVKNFKISLKIIK